MNKPSCPNKRCCRNSGEPSKVVRHGFFRVRCGRRRRYRCLGCRRTFSNRAHTAYFRLRCSSRAFERVALLSVEGMSRAAIARVEGVSWKAVDRWIARANVYARIFNDRKTRGVELVELQADELRTFAPSKVRPSWVFTSMEVCSRLWVSTVVGRRSYRNTHSLLSDTLARGEIVGTPLITTDGFEYYGRVIRQLLGVACVYAQIIKTWRKDRVIKVDRRRVIGTWRPLAEALEHSEDSTRLNTAYIERLNLTLRRSLAYLARRSPCHAHSENRLAEHLELARCYYNFIRRNAALRFGSDRRTPAMVAGLSDRVLGFRDVFVPAFSNT